MLPRPIAVELIMWRTSLGLTPREAAQALSVTPEDYQGWESGTPCPEPELVLGKVSGMQMAPRVDASPAPPAPLVKGGSRLASRLRGGLSVLVPRGLLDGD